MNTIFLLHVAELKSERTITWSGSLNELVLILGNSMFRKAQVFSYGFGSSSNVCVSQTGSWGCALDEQSLDHFGWHTEG